MFCSGKEAESGTYGKQGQLGVGLAVKEEICRRSAYTHDFIDERLMSMRFEMTDECAAKHVLCHMLQQTLVKQ